MQLPTTGRLLTGPHNTLHFANAMKPSMDGHDAESMTVNCGCAQLLTLPCRVQQASGCYDVAVGNAR